MGKNHDGVASDPCCTGVALATWRAYN